MTRIPWGLRYSNNGALTLTATHGAYATLTFNGTAVWIYGAKRGNHGPYDITLDGNDSEYDDYDSDISQQALFSVVGLDATRPYFGIDFVSTPLTTRFKPPIKRD